MKLIKSNGQRLGIILMSVFFADANHMIGLETYLLYKRPSDEDSSKLSDVQPNTTEIAPKSSQVPPNMTKRPKGLPKPNPIPDPSRRASLRASYDQMPAKTEDESSETELNFQKCESAPLRRESERGSRDEMKRFRSLNDKNVSSKPLTPVKKDEETAARAAEEQEEEEEKVRPGVLGGSWKQKNLGVQHPGSGNCC